MTIERLGFCVAALFSVVASLAHAQPADSVFIGRFVTLDKARPTATALAVSEGRILAIGDEKDIAPLLGPKTERVPLPGVTVPGLADAHVHPSGVGEHL